jgi:LysR family transcriptional regulator for bpeEF and oprC
MDQLLAMRVFVRIAEAGSFAKAADSLNLPRSSVSKLLQDLEQHLRTKLVERSTRALTITPEGRGLSGASAETACRSRRDGRRSFGGARSSSARQVARRCRIFARQPRHHPRLADFRARYPGCRVAARRQRPARRPDRRGRRLRDPRRRPGRQLADRAAALHARFRDLRDAGLSCWRMASRPSEELEAKHLAVTYLFPQTGKALPLAFHQGAETHAILPRSAVSLSESTAHGQMPCWPGSGSRPDLRLRCTPAYCRGPTGSRSLRIGSSRPCPSTSSIRRRATRVQS